MIALVLTVAVAASNAGLDQCRKLDKEFDTKAMVKPCQAAADDTTLTVPERVEALRLLAFAHILNGDTALAEPAFMKMLVFSPGVELPADAGTKPKEVFAQVKKRFDEEGKVTASFKAPPPETPAPVALTVDVVDKLGRVVSARVRTNPGSALAKEDKLVRAELGPGQMRFTGTVPEPDVTSMSAPTSIPYDVVLEGWDGAAVPSTPAVTGTITRGGGAVVVEGDGEFPFLWVGVGVVAVLVVGGAAAGVAGWCFAAGPCREQEAWVRVRVNDGVEQ